MDLLSGVKRVVVTVSHTAKNGEPKIVKKCTYPITSLRKVDFIITELAVFEFNVSQLVLKELMPGATVEEVTQKTSAFFVISETIQKNYYGYPISSA